MLPALIPILGGLVSKVVDKVLPGDSEEARLRKLEIESSLISEIAKLNMKQLEINAIEAESKTFWKSGWRPTVAWMGVFALGFTYFQPFINWILLQLQLPPLEGFDPTALVTILMSLLGLGGYRTYEKFKGIAK
jgi:hypothetical protein